MPVSNWVAYPAIDYWYSTTGQHIVGSALRLLKHSLSDVLSGADGRTCNRIPVGIMAISYACPSWHSEPLGPECPNPCSRSAGHPPCPCQMKSWFPSVGCSFRRTRLARLHHERSHQTSVAKRHFSGTQSSGASRQRVSWFKGQQVSSAVIRQNNNIVQWSSGFCCAER